MNKEIEIKTLQSLKGDTYFSELFSKSDIDAMCENIKNDHPIELGLPLFENSVTVTNYRTKIDKLEEQVQTIEENLNDAIDELIRCADQHDCKYYKTVEAIIGKKNTILRKISMGIDLSRDDISYVSNNLK